jgi:hypothetical protein
MIGTDRLPTFDDEPKLPFVSAIQGGLPVAAGRAIQYASTISLAAFYSYRTLQRSRIA